MEQFGRIKDRVSEDSGIRIRRSLSWLEKAQDLYSHDDHDFDSSFIFAWIAFNALYSTMDDHTSGNARDQFQQFFERLIKLDGHNTIHAVIWNRFPTSIRTLMRNRYVFQPFWDAQLRNINPANWDVKLRNSEQLMTGILPRPENAGRVLSLVFDRLYILRNQMMHGCATYQGSVNRSQVRDGSSILNFLVPEILNLMLEHHEVDWGEPAYPVIR